MRINDVFKFLSGAFFVTAGANWYFFVVSHQCFYSFLRSYDDPGVRLHTLRVISGRPDRRRQELASLGARPQGLSGQSVSRSTIGKQCHRRMKFEIVRAAKNLVNRTSLYEDD
jgi:hypothetical protein